MRLAHYNKSLAVNEIETLIEQPDFTPVLVTVAQINNTDDYPQCKNLHYFQLTVTDHAQQSTLGF